MPAQRTRPRVSNVEIRSVQLDTAGIVGILFSSCVPVAIVPLFRRFPRLSSIQPRKTSKLPRVRSIHC
jgi:hypothetical protein